MANAPGGTVTVLFTDVVGSTPLSERLGDDVAQTLRRAHDRILTEQFENFGGRTVKGTGDGFMVAFESARRGVECAVAVQRAIAAQHAQGRYLDLQVRVGLHTGEPVAQGSDLLGIDVNLAERIAGQAAAGKVFVSEVTRLLARQSKGLRFDSRGEHSLKGFADPVTLFEVHWQDEPAFGLTRFVGRRKEVDCLRQALSDAAQGRGGIVFVSGDAGVGKTRLVSDLAIEAADRGFRVLSGRAYETAGMPPYIPFSEALGQHIRDRSPDELAADLGRTAPYIAKVLPQLYQSSGSELPPLEPEAERYRLFEGVSEFLLRLAEQAPLFLFLDDLHCADEATVLLLQHMARYVVDAPLLIVVTYRDAEVDDNDPLANLVAYVVRQRMGQSVPLRPFDSQESARLVGAILSESPAPGVADAVYAATEGNPLFIEELLRHLREEGRDLSDPGAAISELGIPDGIRQVINGRLGHLGADANQLLAYSSVLGRDLSLAEVAALTNKPEPAVLDLLDSALAAHLLVESEKGYAFAHPLIRETLYRGLSRPRRRQLHRRVGEALERLYSADLEAHLTELAHHFCSAAHPADYLAKALDYSVRAGERAMTLAAYEEAVEHFLRARDVLEVDQSSDDARRCDLLLAMGDAQWKAARLPAARETFVRAADLARKLDAPERLAQAALGFGARGMVVGVVDEAAIALLEEALAAVGPADSGLRAMLLARLAEELYFSDDRERRAGLAQQAVDIARRIGDPQALVAAIRSSRFTMYGTDTVEARVVASAEIIQLAERTNDRLLVLQGHYYQLIDVLELGDRASVDEQAAALSRVAEEYRHPRHLWNAALAQAMLAMLDGRLEDGERLAQKALALGQHAGEPDALLTYGVQLILVRREQGRLAELETTMRDFAEQYPAVPSVRCALAYLYGALGRDAEARAEFDRLAHAEFSSLPEDGYRMVGLVLLAELARSLDDQERAATLYRVLLPFRDRNAVINCVVCTGSIARSLGVLAAAMQRWDDAEAHFEKAVDMNSRLRSEAWVATARADYAQMLAARSRLGDREKALEICLQALSTSRKLGMTRLVQETQTLTERLEPGPASATAEGRGI